MKVIDFMIFFQTICDRNICIPRKGVQFMESLFKNVFSQLSCQTMTLLSCPRGHPTTLLNSLINLIMLFHHKDPTCVLLICLGSMCLNKFDPWKIIFVEKFGQVFHHKTSIARGQIQYSQSSLIIWETNIIESHVWHYLCPPCHILSISVGNNNVPMKKIGKLENGDFTSTNFSPKESKVEQPSSLLPTLCRICSKSSSLHLVKLRGSLRQVKGILPFAHPKVVAISCVLSS